MLILHWKPSLPAPSFHAHLALDNSGYAPAIDIHNEYVYTVDIMAGVLGAFEQAVLLALARPKTPLGRQAYGRAILKEVQLRLNREVSAGAVYATLDRLEEKGLIRSKVGAGGAERNGFPRRYYSIHPEGVRALNHARAAVETLWAGVEWPLKGTT